MNEIEKLHNYSQNTDEEAAIPAISRSQVRRDYNDKNFSNPYFERNKPQPKFNTWYYLKALLVIFLVYVVIYSDLFKVGNISVSGTEMISSEAFIQTVNQELSTYKFFVLPRRNTFFLGKKNLSDKINSTYNLESLKIKRGWQSLEISIKEKISYVILYNLKNQTFFFTDLNGRVVQEITKETALQYLGAKKFAVLNVNEDEIKIGDNVITDKMADYILNLDNYLKTQPGLNVQGYEKKGIDEVTLVTKEGWRAYFDINLDIKTSVDNLLLVRSKFNRDKKFEYIDLRFGDKVFYK